MIDLNPFIIQIAHAQELVQAAKPSAIAVLGLNGKLFIGQLINFAIVLLIFWKWVLPTVTKGLQARTSKIEMSLIDAKRITEEKTEFEQWRNSEMSKTRTEASAIITKAQLEANQVKDSVIHQTKDEQQKLVDQAKKQIEQEKNQQLQSAKSELADLVTNATEKILRQKLDEKKDAELIKESLKNI
jgi:F-type H+-transporting ATPase subunit b